MQPQQQPLAEARYHQEWFASYSHGANCVNCRTHIDPKKISRVSRIENALYDMFYREAAPHKAHVCCPDYVMRELQEKIGDDFEKCTNALRDTMCISPLTSVHLYHEASRYVILRRYDAHVDAIEERLERLERLEARVTALEAEVEFLRGLDNARHVDMLHASKKRMYGEAADKKI